MITESKCKNSSQMPFYTAKEELLNAVTHAVGFLFSVFVFVFLFKDFSKDLKTAGALLVYSGTLMLLYGVSTTYHALKASCFKKIMRKLDHCSIFLLIAGTYTPLCVIYIKSQLAGYVLAGVWIAAILGIILNLIDVNKFSKISLACYMVMGWSVLFIIRPTLKSLSTSQLLYLLYGGIFYSIGAILYVLGKKIRYMHSVWHVFVLAGSFCHFMILI